MVANYVNRQLVGLRKQVIVESCDNLIQFVSCGGIIGLLIGLSLDVFIRSKTKRTTMANVLVGLLVLVLVSLLALM